MAKQAVVIVGAGPVGLANAWGIKKLNPTLEVVILEKYAQYQRSHTLVMQPKKLQALMEATGTMQDPDLASLLKKLKNDPHIRTNELEKIFKKIAQDNGVTFIQEEVKKEILHEQLFRDGIIPCLIIGADGTHSTINANLFPEGNLVKHEFDYVLQLRYEIEDDKKAENISSFRFYQLMARQGLIANEYVGSFDNETGKTPVTMQMMITKQYFEELKKDATSKDPLKPFSDEVQKTGLPESLQAFINNYLKLRLKNSGGKIDDSSIRVSVNEAPATYAKQLFCDYDGVPTVLVGDAGLGLSYFKGLNAALESTAKLLSTMAPSIRAGLTDKAKVNKALAQWSTWFLNSFAPKKIKEVASYSLWRIRALWTGIKVAENIKTASVVDYNEQEAEVLKDYFQLLSITQEDSAHKVKLYPHRSYDPVKFGQLNYVPITHTLKKIGKLFADYFKPYKSGAQAVQDFKQPLVGIVDLFIGLAKIVAGIFTLNGRRLGDGVFTFLRGVLEIATTPLAWVVKPITRGIATLIRGRPEIENSTGLKKLAAQGLKELEALEGNKEEKVFPQKMYELLAIGNDLHRKYDKAVQRGQRTHIESDEHARFAEHRANVQRTTIDVPALKGYFKLFAKEASQSGLVSVNESKSQLMKR